MISTLKVVALISGGKDSLFSILHCLANGHHVVALANLQYDPSNSDNEDIDSYMYQTVGGTVMPLYCNALNLPLYREIIRGSAINIDNSYEPHVDIEQPCNEDEESAHGNNKQAMPIKDESSQLDEVESMTRLLKRVKTAYPEINAVCSGAILSTYQRTRVESVAMRLGLIPLSYLWQYPYLPPHRKTSLLEDMASVGQDARTIKVATAGLDDSHLWLNVAEKRTIETLLRGMERFSTDVGDVLGEGGEYETLAIDGPWPLWKKRIEVWPEDRHHLRSGESFTLKIQDAHLVEKGPNARVSDFSVRKPNLLDDDFVKIQDTLQRILHCGKTGYAESRIFDTVTSRKESPVILTQIDQELNRVMVMAQTRGKIISTMILLRDMSSFQVVNQKYSQIFKGPNPPARVTVACGDALAEGIDVIILPTFTKCSAADISALHVQSRSYWAPANIGPYSQAVSVPMSETSARRVYIAGQIPLVPSSMELLMDDAKHESLMFLEQAILSLQHLWRIGRAMNVSWWPNAVCFITASSRDQAKERAAIACKAWTETHLFQFELQANDETGPDAIEDIGDRSLRNPWYYQSMEFNDRARALPNTLVPLPAISKVSEGGSIPPPCLVVQLYALPRQSPIEWYSTGVASSSESKIVSQRHQMLEGSVEVIHCDLLVSTDSFFCAALLNRNRFLDFVARITSPDRFDEQDVQVEIYLSTNSRNELAEDVFVIEKRGFSIIPCQSVFCSGVEQEIFAGVRGMNCKIT